MCIIYLPAQCKTAQHFHSLFTIFTQDFLTLSIVKKTTRRVETPGSAIKRKGVFEMENRMYRECGDGMHSGFRHILPFLAIPLVIGLVRGMARHKFAHMSEMGHGPMGRGQFREDWKNGVPPMFAELHRRAHAAEQKAGAETPPAEAQV
jgi:hypothetical protein